MFIELDYDLQKTMYKEKKKKKKKKTKKKELWNKDTAYIHHDIAKTIKITNE